MTRSSTLARARGRSTGKARCALSTAGTKSAAATWSSPGTGGPCPCENEADAGEVIPARQLGEKQRRKRHSHRRHQVQRRAGPGCAEPRHHVAPPGIREEQRSEERRVGKGWSERR